MVDDDEAKPAPLGIVTDRDIVVEVLGNGLDPATTTVGSIIRTPVVIAHDGEDASQALERMSAHGVRRMPVVSAAGTLVGIITADDILKRLAADANLLAQIVSREQTREERSRR